MDKKNLNSKNIKQTKRVFSTGAIRDISNGKFEYLGAINPLCDYSFAKYMYNNSFMPDGSIRSASNWQKGFGKDVLIQSLVRHIEDLKLIHSGYILYELRHNGTVSKKIVQIDGLPNKNDDYKYITEEECLNAIRFNSEAYKLDVLMKS